VILHPKVLIIAAEDSRAEQIEALFKGSDYQAFVAPDVLSAMALLKTEEIDLALLDSHADGLSVTDAVRILKCLQHTVIMPVMCLLPEDATPALRADVLDAGGDDCVLGTIDATELQARVRKLLSIRILHQDFLHGKTQLEGALSRESQLLRQLRSDNRQLRKQSITDGLTSLYNHQYLMEWLRTEFKIARRYGHPISFAMADLDHFKQINDQYGHPFGDFILKEVAVIAKMSARESDLVARYGGEEFAMVLPRTDHDMARVFAERFHEAVGRRTFQNATNKATLSVSIGLATYPHHAEITSPEMLVYLADQALLQAKASGRDGIIAWHDLDVEQRAMIRRRLSGAPGAHGAVAGSADPPT